MSRKIDFRRANQSELDEFDELTKACTMNCGPHRDDPRRDKERKFLCEDCLTTEQNDRFGAKP